MELLVSTKKNLIKNVQHLLIYYEKNVLKVQIIKLKEDDISVRFEPVIFVFKYDYYTACPRIEKMLPRIFFFALSVYCVEIHLLQTQKKFSKYFFSVNIFYIFCIKIRVNINI